MDTWEYQFWVASTPGVSRDLLLRVELCRGRGGFFQFCTSHYLCARMVLRRCGCCYGYHSTPQCAVVRGAATLV
ncbi:MAG: hypothetical protein ACRDHZ_00125, partial [Ktedonobacteraceae bacterium]